MAARIAATRLSTFLPALRKTASIRYEPIFRVASLRFTPHRCISWSAGEVRQETEAPEAQEAQEISSDPQSAAFKALSNQETSESDMDIELPFNIFPDRSNLPPLVNIPPQQDPLLAYLASRLMNHGHRAKASRIVSRMLLNIHAYTRAPPLPIFRQAIFALAPSVRLLKHRHSTKTVYKPVALSEKQGIWFAMKWLIDECKSRQGGPMVEERLAREVIKILKGESKTLEKKEEVHKMAMVNRGNVGNKRPT
ncbi:ribosomal protein S7 domain-containing protein [Rhodocollybia butyracea]|uniref:Ribosomal protein S7 domain-containing protein n=1 Tax=Rhodocollybia butyracea TaxID=206335 RepID=A0A9P5UE59_9AGAR|nr:ribosomal protein S7 domain-containing protein [Rhodocollybia butyracea]